MYSEKRSSRSAWLLASTSSLMSLRLRMALRFALVAARLADALPARKALRSAPASTARNNSRDSQFRFPATQEAEQTTNHDAASRRARIDMIKRPWNTIPRMVRKTTVPPIPATIRQSCGYRASSANPPPATIRVMRSQKLTVLSAGFSSCSGMMTSRSSI